MLILLFFALPLYANIDARIDAIQKASVEERFKLMNAFKKEVIHMKEEERIDAIAKLKSITRSRHGSRALKELKGHTTPANTNKPHTRVKHEEKIGSHFREENEIEVHTENETEDQIENEVEDHIENETEDHIEDETEDQIENETEDHIEDEHDDDDD